MDKGSIHIYCGEGKGKTTAAIGQGIQEASQGRSVIIIQFMKERNAEAIGFVQRLEPEIKLFRFQKAEEAFEDLPDAEKAEEIKNLKNALNFARKVLAIALRQFTAADAQHFRHLRIEQTFAQCALPDHAAGAEYYHFHNLFS